MYGFLMKMKNDSIWLNHHHRIHYSHEIKILQYYHHQAKKHHDHQYPTQNNNGYN